MIRDKIESNLRGRNDMAKKKEENAAVETEETKAKFREKLKSLLELGKKKRNILEYQEISDFFQGYES